MKSRYGRLFACFMCTIMVVSATVEVAAAMQPLGGAPEEIESTEMQDTESVVELEISGTEAAETEEEGTETADTETAGTEEESTETADTETAGTEEESTETAGTEEESAETADTETADTETENGATEEENTETILEQEAENATRGANSKNEIDWQMEEEVKGADSTTFYANVADGDVVDGYYIRKVPAAELTKNASSAVQTALTEASENATDDLPYKVVIEPGTYKLNSGFRIGSNTYLYMDGVTFKQNSGISANMLKVGGKADSEYGYCYRNITLYGGVWNQNNNSITAIKIAHAENFTIENQTLCNAKNSHLIEAAGINGLTIRGCTFKNQILEVGISTVICEAVQIDVLVKGHFSGYAMEDLSNQNILVENCTFDNVSRGVGSHTGILNNPVNNVQIVNNQFKRVASTAINVFNYQNCTFSGNVISDAPRGIAIYSLRKDVTYPATAATEKGGSTKTPTKYVKPSDNQNIVISDNTISCSGKDAYSNDATTCIHVGGVNCDKDFKNKEGDVLPAGNYYLSGITISGNTLTTERNGIQLQDARNAVITGNKIEHKGTESNSFGISLELESIQNSITGNTINNCRGTALVVNGKSYAKSISQNTIKSARYAGICLENGTTDTIAKNIISNACGGDSPFGAITIISGKAGEIKENKINTSGTYGIVQSGGTIGAITGNVIKKCGIAQIVVKQESSKKSITIQKNTLTGKVTAAGIVVYTGQAVIDANKISSCNTAITLSDAAKATIGVNTYQKNKSNGVEVGGKIYKNLAQPKVTSAKAKDKKSITLKWKTMKNVDGYQIYRAASKNGKYTKIGTVSGDKASYVSKKLKSNKTYYYKIVAYSQTGNKNVTFTSPYSKVLSAKTKK